MSGTANVPNSFAAAVTATGAQLDANYTTIVAYLNDPTNRNNYVSDTGNTNTVVLTFVPPFVGGYTAGAELTWKWAQTNTTAVVINANGLGNINLVNQDGSSVLANQGLIGSIGKAVYDGTRAIYLTPPAPATAAQVSATASINAANFVSPKTVQNHSGVAKAWANWQGTSTGTISADAGYNVASISRAGTGSYSILFATPFADTNFVGLVMTGGANGAVGGLVISKTVSTFVFITFNTAGAVTDSLNTQFVAFGNQ